MKSATDRILCTLVLLGLSASGARSQIVPDTTLPSNSIVTPDSATLTIDGGTEVGSNLFHSFEAFSLPTDIEAYFNNSGTIDNIITRVTGGQISSIDGLIRANGTANLFLLNPNGIHFGDNASLAVGGSFLASTADRLVFEDNSFFDAANPNTPPLLTVSVPVGVQFGDRPNPGRITNTGTLTARGDLTLSGGTVASTGQLLAGRGLLAIEAVAGDLQVENALASNITLTANGNAIAGNLQARQASGGGDISLEAGGNILIDGNLDASAIPTTIPQTSAELSRLSFNGDGGNITLTAEGNITFVPGTSLVFSLGIRGGDIRLESGGAIVVEDTFIGNLSTGSVQGGDITLIGNSVLLRDFGRIATITVNEGRGGDIKFDAAETIDFLSTRERSELGRDNPFVEVFNVFFADVGFSSTGIGATTLTNGRGGDIILRTSRLSVRDRTSPDLDPDLRIRTGITTVTATGSSGDGGDIRIDASESVELVGNQPGEIVTSLDDSIALTVILIPAGLTSATNGRGDGGDVTIDTGRLTIRDRAAATSGNTFVSRGGSSGNLTVNADLVELQGLAGLVSATVGTGDAGDLVVNADAIVVRDGAAISADTLGSGNAGLLTIETRTLSLENGSRVGAATVAGGRGSTARVSASESIDIVGTSADGTVPSGLFADSQGRGEAGTLAIDTGELRVRDGASITVSSRGSAPRAGDLEIAAETLQLENGGAIDATTNAGDGGDITLQVEELLLLRQESNISTTAGTDEAGGNGGNIDIDTDFIVALPTEDSNITANAFAGNGGSVNITAQSVFGIEFRPEETPLSDITASSEFGQQGVVTFEVPDIDPASGLVNLPESPVDATGLVGDPCDRGIGKFVTTGRSGIPPTPYDPIDSSEILEDLQPPVEWDEETTQIGERLVEATGWRTNDRGQVELVARISDIPDRICP
ncbi:MAG: filamentous hemagglutinin N-terminal domain-containing protein [Cyanobacteriota bacterium]|nr:filamentous hemagglutinin N-terminal domain-containing protein [Cyanobacteriota bacterium]